MNQLLAMRVFVKVVETGSFSRTADQLMLPRSTASKLIVDLEEYLGSKLMHRTTRTITTTPEGMEYYNHALRLITELDAVDNAVRGKKLRPHGPLRVDVPVSFANGCLIPELPDFHCQYPDVNIALGLSDRPINIVGEGVDCAIRTGKLADMDLIGRKITELQYVTCASPSYLEAKGVPVSPQDVRNSHRRIGYFSGTASKAEKLVFENDIERHEIDNFDFSANQGDGLINMLLAGLGIGQHLRRFVEPYLVSGELIAILEEWKRPPIPIHIIYPSLPYQNARLKVFVDWLLDRFKED